MTYYIYKITNVVNNKIYIGKTNNPKYRWYKHRLTAKDTVNKYKKYPIHFAIKMYGEDNFIFKIIDQTENENEILQKEIDYISYFKNTGTILYNITDGGEGVSGYIPTKDTRDKISKSNKGKLSGNKNPMFGKGYTIIGENNPFYGKEHSQYNKEKMSIKRTGNKNPRAILNENIVFLIRENKNNLSVKELSEKYNVAPITIYKILDFSIWKNV